MNRLKKTRRQRPGILGCALGRTQPKYIKNNVSQFRLNPNRQTQDRKLAATAIILPFQQSPTRLKTLSELLLEYHTDRAPRGDYSTPLPEDYIKGVRCG